MKKTVKRILCSTLALAMASTLVVESALRLNADKSASGNTVSAPFTNVTGKFDTSALRAENFNTSVMTSEVKPTYETRTVMVTLSGNSLSDASGTQSVTSFARSFTGEKISSDILSEQNAFLRALKKQGIAYKLKDRYDVLLNAVAIEIDTQYVSQIKKMDGVKSAVITKTYAEPKTIKTSASQEVFNTTSKYETGIYNSLDYTDVNNAYNNTDGAKGDYGEGTVIAVLDTGLDYTHEAFQYMPENPAWSNADVAEKLNTKSLIAEQRSGSLDVKDVYVSAKVPFAYDYADDDPDVYPSYSNHGTHVAGIIGGYSQDGYTDKEGNEITDKEFRSVVPDSQLVICKVFTDDLDDEDLGGAVAEDIVAALEDCVLLGVDVINMSLGTSCGFSTTDDGDDEGEMLNAVYENIKKAGISLVCAASNDYSSGYGGVFGTNLISNPDSSTVGSPSTFAASLSVASISGQESPYMVTGEGDNETFVFYEESRDENGNPYDFAKSMLAVKPTGEYEYVVVPGTGATSDYTESVRKLFQNENGSLNRIALIKRGDSTFQEKVEVAMRMGAVGVIVYNNVAGIIRMNLGEIDNPVPSVSINMDAGNALIKNANLEGGRVGKIKISLDTKAGPFMSEFSSWGPTHDLKLKPEITAHGGEITSTVPGGYGEQSGTSMASPNMAGVMALVRNYIKTDLAHLVKGANGEIDAVKLNRLANQLMMSTATTVYDQTGKPYSPRKQGAGLGSLANVIDATSAYLWVDNAESDYRPKLEIGDNEEKESVYGKDGSLTFHVTNFGATDLQFTADYLVFTETIAADGLAVAEQAHMFENTAASWKVTGEGTLSGDDTITVKAGKTATVSVEITLTDTDLDYLDRFPNGMYVEGFLKLKSSVSSQCDLSIPFLGFHGDWEGSPMLDYTAYEVAADEQDASKKDEEKIKASVWATQPFSTYYNEKYILPMGSYVYLVAENDDPVYTDEKYNAVSRYNQYYGEGNAENYLTSTAIKAVYAGLLRNARQVQYTLYNEETGEEIKSDYINRVGKAYSGGGSAVPANVELELNPEIEGLAGNGSYRMDFAFYMDMPDGNTEPDGTYSFTFTVDYEAPVLEDARIRYYNYKDGNKEKQRIYLDVDVYDNHYAQAIMLCYPTENADGELVLQLATEYPTPVRNGNKNGTTTVSIEITDLYAKYGNQMYLQIDDYAINSCLYQLNLDALHTGNLPENFELAEGEENIELDVYETHKVSLNYEGDADLSNFKWISADESKVGVRNGEIVGLAPTGDKPVKVTVTNRNNGVTKDIFVTVTQTQQSLSGVPSISFDVIRDTASLAILKAQGMVEVHAGKTFALEILKDPWYHPMTGMEFEWSSTNEAVATVDENGNVTTLKKGTAIIEAKVIRDGVATLYSASVTLKVVNEFTVNNYTLQDYNGVGYNKEDGVLWIPSDLNIMQIGIEAFKDNDNIKKIVIPSSVTQIGERAFENCSALEEVYFVSTTPRESVVNGNKVTDASIDWADLSMIYGEAFLNCKNLKKIDLSNAKTITVANDCFKGCTALSEVVDMPSIGTMHHRAFAGCTALTSVDLTGLHMSGNSVFAGCTGITSVTTGKFTAIGNEMFKGCNKLTNVTISTSKLGDGAFEDCTKLTSVRFVATQAGYNFDIGARAFKNCGTATSSGLQITFGDGGVVRTIGENAFEGTRFNALTISDAFEISALTKGGLAFKNMTVRVADGSTKYTEENDVIYNKDKTKLLFVNGSVTSDDFVVPASVTEIGSYAFANNRRISKVTLHNAVTKLGEGAFENSAVKTIDFNGASITEIPARTFYGAGVTDIALPDTVTALGDFAFASSSLRSMTANGLTKLGNSVFRDCRYIVRVKTVAETGVNAVVLPDTVTEIGDYGFYGCAALVSAQLPSLEKLGLYTFGEANALTSVSFGANATATGTYTFANTKVANVSLADTQTVIGEGVFYNCTELTKITLSNQIEAVEAWAFFGARKLATVDNLQLVPQIGAYAFYNTALTELNLAEATDIGYGAFAAEPMRPDENFKAKYTSISIPKAVTVGAYAFYNGAMTMVDIPESVTEIGYGAFASANNLVGFKVNNNAKFTVKDANENGYGVLYRYIDKNAETYELVCYPAGREQTANEDGKKIYEVAEGTLYVKAGAFLELNNGALDGVVLPYSVNAIGDDAFFASGIKEFTFESIQAPVLEVSYREDVASQIEYIATESAASYYRGYYYTNFEMRFVDLTEFGTEKSELAIRYPENGVGYDNFVYSLYFNDKTTTGIHMTDDTRVGIAKLEAVLAQATTVESWLTAEVNAENKATIEAFAKEVMSARTAYDNIVKDATQISFVSEKEAALVALETNLRAVKERFGIKTAIKYLQIQAGSTYKSQYNEGEKFDMTGLIVEIVYEDLSREIADAKYLTLAEAYTGELTYLNNYVEIVYNDGENTATLSLDITVARGATDNNGENTGEVEDKDNSKLWLILGIVGGVLLIAGGATAVVIVMTKRKKAVGAVETAEENKPENEPENEA